ncbi:MAG TPA: rhomboid family intramembrane serine protease [Terriglobales bacterium]|nr:rhomboid family intramembrane serine protease [Terriglobales bacterium]
MSSVSLSQALVGINILVYLAMGIVGGGLFSDPTSQQLIRSGANFGPLTFGGEWWRLLSYAFLHGSLLHVGFNMWCLWSLGSLCESLYGTWTFGAIYFTSAVAGGLASVGVHPERLSVGASGAIFGLAGALIAGFYLGEFSLPRPVIQAQLRSLVFFVGYNIVIGAVSGPTDNLCHLGGLVAGLFCGALIARVAPSEHDVGARFAIIGFAALTLAGITFGLERSRGYVIHARHGIELLREQKYDAAIAELRTAVQMRPGYVPARFNLANAYYGKQQYAQAEAELKRVLEIDPENDDATYFLGFNYLAEKHAPEARQTFSRLVAKHPNLPGGHYGLGMALAAEGNLREAVEEFKTTARLRPEFEGVHYRLGQAQADLGLYDDAIASFQNEITNTDDYDTEIALAHAYEKKGMHEKAAEALERAEKLKGK